VLESPHPFDDVNISFACHNKGRNWRRVNFNREVKLMLLDLHADYWEEYVEHIVGSFGRLINWSANDRSLARVLVRARVVDLESVPQLISFIDTKGFDGLLDHTMLQHEMLRARLADEDPILEQQLVEGQHLLISLA
jgi:hypothetical protein